MKLTPAALLAAVAPIETTPMAAAIRDQLSALLKEEPFGVPQLHRASMVAAAGKELLKAASPALPPSARPHGTIVNTISGGSFVLPNPPVSSDEPYYEEDGDNTVPAALVTSSPAETYGAKMLQELSATMSGLRSSPEKIVRAISEARNLGLPDLAESLERELRTALALPPPSTPQPVRIDTVPVAAPAAAPPA